MRIFQSAVCVWYQRFFYLRYNQLITMDKKKIQPRSMISFSHFRSHVSSFKWIVGFQFGTTISSSKSVPLMKYRTHTNAERKWTTKAQVIQRKFANGKWWMYLQAFEAEKVMFKHSKGSLFKCFVAVKPAHVLTLHLHTQHYQKSYLILFGWCWRWQTVKDEKYHFWIRKEDTNTQKWNRSLNDLLKQIGEK